MSQLSPKEIMDGFEASRAKTFAYMAQEIIDELGEERGKQVIRDTVWKMSKSRISSANSNRCTRSSISGTPSVTALSFSRIITWNIERPRMRQPQRLQG